MDTFLVLMCITSALIVIATLVTYEHMLREYEHMLREARRERDRAIEHCEQAQALLTAASRHPAVRRLPGLSVIDGGAK